MKSSEPRNRDIYRGTLEQKKAVWKLWATGHIVKEIAGKLQLHLSEGTIYNWIREFKELSAENLHAYYEEDGLPELVVNKWKSYHGDNPKMIKEIDELIKKALLISDQQAGISQVKNAVIKPPECFEKDEWGCCRNASMRSDCGPCFYLRVGRTQEEIDRLIELTLSLPDRVEKAKEEFFERDKNNGTN